jgi:hypothetical protein
MLRGQTLMKVIQTHLLVQLHMRSAATTASYALNFNPLATASYANTASVAFVALMLTMEM